MRIRNRTGYLLIELMIALVLLSGMGMIIGQIKGHVAMWRQQANAYLKAVTLANAIITGENPKPDGSITFQKIVSHPFPKIPYASIVAKITIPFGESSKTFTFIGGWIEYSAKK